MNKIKNIIKSNILGFIVGIIEGFALVFITLFILKQPQFNIDLVNESSMKSCLDALEN